MVEGQHTTILYHLKVNCIICCHGEVVAVEQFHLHLRMQGRVRDARHPTLYLLHGLSDDHSTWMRRTSIERYATELGLAVVMPAVNRSFSYNFV